MVLDFMRREKKKVLGLFLIPLIFGLIAYLIPGFSGGWWGGKMQDSVLAQVGKVGISAAEFSTAYSRFLRNNRMPYDRQFLRQLNFDQQMLNQLISREVIKLEARRLGLDATAKDIQQKVLTMPYFQENGSFQMARYQGILRSQNMAPAEFEDEIRLEMVQNRLRSLITQGVNVSDQELEKEYRNRNEKVKIAFVALESAMYTNSVVASEEDLKTFFNGSRENYRIPEQRKVNYLFINVARLGSSVQVSETELRNYYEQNLQTYKMPERVRASHILFKTEGKTPEDVAKIRTKAMDVLKQAKSGADFAALAKKHSEDASASNGGDLGFFGRGQMVPPFESSAFSLGIGAISELVTSQFGFHIIKVLEKQEARTQKFEEVANLIRPTLVQQRADRLAQDLSDKAYSRTRTSATLEPIARELNLELVATPFFTQGGGLPQIGNSPDFSSKVFALKPKEIGSAVRVASGYVIAQLLEIKPPYIPELAEVRARVEQDFKSSKSVDVARNKAVEFSNKVKGGGNFDAVAKAMSLPVKTSEPFARNGSIADLGSSTPVDDFAFAGNPGDISQPLAIGQKQVVCQIKEKFPVKPEDFAKEKESLKNSMLSQRKDQAFQAYLDEVNSRMKKAGKIKVNEKSFNEISRRM